jgi:hypothetical protein
MNKPHGRQPVTLERARQIFGNVGPPASVWEDQFDGFDEDLARLAQTPLAEIDPSDLWYYFHDLTYQTLQPDLFHYLFPACLWDWHQTLLANEACSHGDADFHRALFRGNIFEKMMNAAERRAVIEFLGDSFLDRIDRERGLSGWVTQWQWIGRLNSLAMIAPIDELWRNWWSLTSPGQAVCLIVYVSDLMYTLDENPLIDPPDEFRGRDLSVIGWDFPPLIAAADGLLEAGWLPQNTEFLRESLSADGLHDSLLRATARLTGEPEHDRAARVLQDFPDRREIVLSRIGELPTMLSLPERERRWTRI